MDDPFVRRLRDQRQKHLGLWSLGLLARWLSRCVTILALAGHFLIIVKIEDHDIRVPILGMGREVAIFRRIRILFKTTTNLHDLERTVLLAPVSIRSTARESRPQEVEQPFGLAAASTEMDVRYEQRSKPSRGVRHDAINSERPIMCW